jgi:predicted ATPase
VRLKTIKENIFIFINMDLKDLENFLELSESNTKIILTSILDNNIKVDNKIKVSDSIYTDTKINEWINKKTITRGGSILIDKIIRNPINDIKKLKERQNVYFELFKYQLQTLKDTENDLLWIMTLKKEIDEDMSINLLFPSTFLLNKCNYYRCFLDVFHLYKIVLMPLTCLLYPISIIYTPYYYLNKYMRLNLKIGQYLKMMLEFLKLVLKPSGNIRKDLIKIVTFLIYVGIYVYSIYQTFLISYIIYKTREKLLIKIKGLVDFIKTASIIIKKAGNLWKPFYLYENDIDINESLNFLSGIKYDISTIYKLWKNDEYKVHIINMLKVIYTIDVINTITKIKKKNKHWCLPSYHLEKPTKIWNMKNPLLKEDTQISNPVNLKKNLIITGVNAGGKTTYVKSIASNIILSQTFGIMNAIKAEVLIYDAIHSFMRITDELGSKSYFEAETDCCNKMIKIADELTKVNKKGLFLLDEPMHSTPPIEGISVAFSVCEYLGLQKGITIIITTHFHDLMKLENKYKEDFINLSVSAKRKEGYDDEYEFDYKIKKGGSRQTIAIELLKKQKFNSRIISSAIEMKNKICNQDVRNDI